MSHFVYILECADKTLYIGSTNDLEKRLHAHNFLKTGARYTRSRRPVRLVYSEKKRTIGAALRREHALKCLTRSEKILIVSRADSGCSLPR